jgi:hypothetical protein
MMTRLTRWRSARKATGPGRTGEDQRLGYSVDPHADGNEHADSRIRVLQPDGSILRPGPPDIHSADVADRSIGHPTTPPQKEGRP